jgi:hypothetical protein
VTGTTAKRILGGLALGCAAVLACAVSRLDECFRTPDLILHWFSLPLLGLALASAFLLLPGTGRLALGATLATWALLEIGFGLGRAWRDPRVDAFVSHDYFQPDPVLGYGPLHGIRARARKRIDGQNLYDVEYAIDEAGRRVTPVESQEGRDRFLLFFGDSFTFGEGVQGDETLSAFVARRAARYVPYNYAFHGYGPNQLLAKLESDTLRQEVREPKGMAVYVFIGAHVSRAIGSMVVYTGWAHDAPYYALDGEGTPRRMGTFTTGRPWTSIAYALLGRSQVLSFLHLDLPLVVTDHHVELAARLIERSALLFHEQFGPQRFVAVAYPEQWPSEISRRLARALTRDGIEVLDYASLFEPHRADYFFPADRHPKPEAHRAVAERLVADLGLADDPARDPVQERAIAGTMGSMGDAPEPPRRAPSSAQAARRP